MDIRRIDLATEQGRLTEELINASTAYYNGGNTAMSDLEFDRKVVELTEMEQASGFAYEGSPTIRVGSAPVGQLKRVEHEYPALSLGKFKYAEREKLVEWMNGMPQFHIYSMMWKMDGLTVVLTYDNGKLTRAVTRGDGYVGSDITHNAVNFEGVPVKIPDKRHIVVRGEAVMKFAEFERVNAECDGQYDNPRNLASATIQMLDPEEAKKRKITFYAFELVTPEPVGSKGAMDYRLNTLHEMGFNVVEHIMIANVEALDMIEKMKTKLPENEFPTDGLVFSVEDLESGWKLGSTGHHPRWSVALKWTDETFPTKLKNVEWSVGKTGIVTPVAVFDTVRMGLGSDVNRASLHNISVMRQLGVRNGADLEVYMANAIIPQVANAENGDSEIDVPDRCPVCGAPLRIENHNDIETLHCDNTECPARQTGSLLNTFSQEALYAKGLGESQITDLIEHKAVTADPMSFFELSDAYFNGERKSVFEGLEALDGWGAKKVENLMKTLREAKKTNLQKFLVSLNVPMLGKDLSKKLARLWNGDINVLLNLVKGTEEDRKRAYAVIKGQDGIGDVKADNLFSFINSVADNEEKRDRFLRYVSMFEFESAKPDVSGTGLDGLTFVITGSVHVYKNRKEFEESVTARGGKVSGSVSAKTSYLVINDKESTSSKTMTAKKLNIPMLSEEEFIEKFGR